MSCSLAAVCPAIDNTIMPIRSPTNVSSIWIMGRRLGDSQVLCSHFTTLRTTGVITDNMLQPPVKWAGADEILYVAGR